MKSVVIGCGRMGVRHIQVLQSMNYNLVGALDLSEASLENLVTQKLATKDQTFTNASQMFAKVKPQLAIIATTAPTHLEYVEQAVKAGVKYILCEKPLATSLADCQKMVDLCEKNGVKLAVNHQMRFMEQYTAIQKLVKDTNCGEVKSIQVSAGNFGIAMNGCHYFEMLRFILGEYPQKVSAWFSKEEVPNPRGKQFKDHAGSIRIETKSGKRFYMEASADQGHGVTVTYVTKFGQIFVDELLGHMYINYRHPESEPAPTTRYGQPAKTEVRTIAGADILKSTGAVIEALVAGENYPSGKDGLMAVKTLVAAHMSNEQNGKAINLTDEKMETERVFPWA